jgi:hypothetical protein
VICKSRGGNTAEALKERAPNISTSEAKMKSTNSEGGSIREKHTL